VERLNNTVFEDPITTALSPSAKLMQLLFGKQITYSIAAVARLGVADHMSATPVAIDLLAEKVGAQTPSLYRVMRMLSSVGVFRQTERQFALTPVGELLRSDHKNSARYRAMLRGEEWTTRAYEHFANCVRTGEDGVTKAYGRNMFELLAERPDQADTFHRAMTDSSAVSSQAILEAYDFSGIQRLADIGGGHGLFLAGILRQYPRMQGVLYDLPEVLATVPPAQFGGCESRIHFEGGSFFARAPEGCGCLRSEAYPPQLERRRLHQDPDAVARATSRAWTRAYMRNGHSERPGSNASKNAGHRNAAADSRGQGAIIPGISGFIGVGRTSRRPHCLYAESSLCS
jgi:hypothetical protein